MESIEYKYRNYAKSFKVNIEFLGARNDIKNIVETNYSIVKEKLDIKKNIYTIKDKDNFKYNSTEYQLEY